MTTHVTIHEVFKKIIKKNLTIFFFLFSLIKKNKPIFFFQKYIKISTITYAIMTDVIFFSYVSI